MAKRENDLGRDPIGKLLLRLAVPTVTAQLVNALYNIVDRIYIGHIPGEGDLALTGLGICFPVILFVSAISALVGMGGGSRAVVRMGEGKLDEANKILGNCTLLLMILGLAATVVFQLCKEPMAAETARRRFWSRPCSWQAPSSCAFRSLRRVVDSDSSRNRSV